MSDNPSIGGVRSEVQAYIERQPQLAWRRRVLNGLLLLLVRILSKTEITGIENIPAEGPTVLMMNHISGIDPIICMAIVRSRFVIPMTKEENAQSLFLGPFVRWYGAYTVRRGEVDRSALLNSIALLKSGQLILIAPEGTRSAAGLQEPKDGLAYVATKADAVIVPTAIADAADWLDRLKRFRRVRVRVAFGKPFKFKDDGRSRIPRDELAQMTREAMYQLALALPDPALRGVYSDVENATTQTLEFV